MKQGVFTVGDNAPLSPRLKRLRLLGDSSAIARPGQFVSLALPGFFLRRPFSVCDWDASGFSIVYEQVGKGTDYMRSLRTGDRLDVLTGLGNGFDLSRAGNAPVLIGGGSGVSPMLGLARRLLTEGRSPRVILGFGTREDVALLEDFRLLGVCPTITTLDGSFGLRGLVTDALEELQPSFFYACGPEAMLRAVAECSACDGQMSFDARMGCGFGACMGCTRMTRSGPKRVCRDGPVFDRGEIVWED
ncbi:MAG: dihydroorotate dehydrogenase electron transfer subunit [Oscillospiraceae bacterium]|nr:dihydroorotate dehydrogenase electron transfer subunit [Oscillospiraceae bacterium]